ncbi:MAG: hypothetical protein RLZZ618_2837 [Pseudomonadota bacterium]|jgi:MFS family permease
MKKGFYTIMAAQFFSSMADQALLVAAIAMLELSQAASWQKPALAAMFALPYVVLAPLLGAFADAVPKGKVMFYANAMKVVGCLMMLFGAHPLLSYVVVGIGAAAYSPAKYGILTELLPNSQLVKANGWVEGLTILSIIFGIVLGGQLVGPVLAPKLLSFDLPMFNTGIDTAPEAAILFLVVLYVLAALFNIRIPRTDAPLQPLSSNIRVLVQDFSSCNYRLWADKLGQISLATTTLFWGVSGNLRVIVFSWAAAALFYTTTQAANLVGFVALGIAIGAVTASMKVRLDQAPKVIPLGILMGVLLIGMNLIRSDTSGSMVGLDMMFGIKVPSEWVAAPFLMLLGMIAGFLVVPMNALLQHRGHNLMGAGRSIAVQNFNEQACIFVFSAFYTGMVKFGLSAFTAIAALGLVVTGIMVLIQMWHASNLVRHKQEVDHLLALARSDQH